MSVYIEMDGFFSLLQTVLWVGLIAVLVWRYHDHLKSILVAIQKRIETGSGVKAGWLEIQAQVQPQDTQQQLARLDQEVAEISNETKEDAVLPAPVAPTKSASDVIKSRYLTAEDLVLRDIQSEFKVPLSRQVRVGLDLFDGFFSADGKSYIVEVKYVMSSINKLQLQHTVQRILARAGSLGWKNFQLILAIVVGDSSVDLVTKRLRVLEWFRDYGVVDVRCYSYDELSRKYGISSADD